MNDQSLNFLGLYNSNISEEAQKINSSHKPTLADVQTTINKNALKNAQKDYGSIETMSFYNPLFQNQYKPRYEASWQYKNLGFDPHRDNETLYNEKMSGIDKFQRAGKNMVKVMGASMVDQLTFGATSLMTADKFAEANAIGGSSEKGMYGSILNLMINSGFTLGIGLECFLEGVLINGLTFGATSALTAAKTGRAANTIRRGLSMAEATRKQRLITQELESMTKASKLSEFAKKAGDFLNPLENTASFIKDAKTAERLGMGMGTAEKITKGTTALWRDVQAARGVYTEAKLEGNFAMKDMQDKWLMDYQQMYGKAPSEEEAKKFRENALAANFATSMINMPLIYLTNKITLAPIFRPLEKSYAGQVFGEGSKKVFMDVSDSGLRTIKRLPDETLKRIKFLAMNSPMTLARNTLKYSGENFMEGAQEVLQEITSGAAKEYYLDNYDGTLKGSWYNYMLSNAANQVSKQGLETFASGMLMQAFLSPIYRITGGISRGSLGRRDTVIGRTLDKIDDFRHRDDAEYKNKKKDLREKENAGFNQEIEQLNYFFENAANYFNGNFEEMSKSKKFADTFQGKDYASLSDEEKKDYVESVHQRMNGLLVNAMQRGYYSSVIDQFNDMSKTIKNSREELVSDIGEQQAAMLEKNIDGFIEKAKSIKEDYDLVTNTFKIPFSDEDIKRTIASKDLSTFNQMIFANEAYKKAVSDYVFAKDSLKLGISRQNEINTEAMRVYNDSRSQIPWDSISMLYDFNTIQQRLDTIHGMLNGVNGEPGLLSTKEAERPDAMKKQISDFELEDVNLQKLKDAVYEYQNAEKIARKKAQEKGKEFNESDVAKIQKDAKKTIRQATRAHLAIMDQIHNPDAPVRKYATYDKLADLITEYNEISFINHINNQSIEYLTDPDIWQKNIDVIAKAAESVYNQRDEEISESIRKAKDSDTDDELSHELLKAGIVCRDLEAVKRTKKMPQYVYDADTKAKYNYLSKEYQIAAEIIKKYIPDVEDIPIPERKTSESEGRVVDDKTIDDFKNMGIVPGKTYTAEELLQKFYADGNIKGEKYYKARKELALQFLRIPAVKGIKVKIVDNAKQALKIEDKEITLDLRYFTKNTKDHIDYSFALLKGVTGVLTIDGIKDEKSDFFKDISALYDDAKKRYDEAKVNTNAAELNGFVSLQDFIVEALTNERFQLVLASMKSDKKSTLSDRNIFTKYVEMIRKYLADIFKIKNTENTLLNDTLNIITDYISQSEGIEEQKEETEVVLGIGVTSKGTDLVASLSNDELDIISNTYLLVNGKKRNGKSNADIVLSTDFANWWAEEPYVVQSFIASHNEMFNDKRKFRLTSNIASIPLSYIEEQNYRRSGRPSRLRMAILAQKLMEGHLDIAENKADISSEPSLFSPTEMDIWNQEDEFGNHVNRKEIRSIINKISQNVSDTSSANVFEYIKELNTLGYDNKELIELKAKRNGDKVIARLAAMAIPYDELTKIAMTTSQNNNLQSAKNLIMSNELSRKTTKEELDSWRLNMHIYLSNVPINEIPAGLTHFEVERLYKERLEEFGLESAETAEPAEEQTEEQTEVKGEIYGQEGELVRYNDEVYMIREVNGDEVTLIDYQGNEIKADIDELGYIETGEYVTLQQEFDEKHQQYLAQHNEDISQTQNTDEENNEIAEQIEAENQSIESSEEENKEQKRKLNDKLLNLADKIVEDFKGCR